MMDAIIHQFKHPTGWVGRMVGWIMTTRPSNRQRIEWTVERLHLSSTDHVFELGCGPGYGLELASNAAHDGLTIGVDHSGIMTDMARGRLREKILTGHALIRMGDQQELLAFSGNIDAIFSTNVIQFLSDKAEFFEFTFATLRRNGRVATTYQPRGKKPSSEKAERMAQACVQAMKAAGFCDVRTEWLPLNPIPAACVIGTKP